ncbi:MAG: hypothetical protein QW320_11615 [Ignisphaera sp.]
MMPTSMDTIKVLKIVKIANELSKKQELSEEDVINALKAINLPNEVIEKVKEAFRAENEEEKVMLIAKAFGIPEETIVKILEGLMMASLVLR